MIFRILAKNVANITKAAFYLSRLTFCQKNVFGEKEINTCGFSGNKSQNFGGKVSRRNFWGNKICKKKGNSNPSLYLGEKASNFSPKVPSKAVRMAFYVSKGWIPGKKRKYTVLWFSRTPRKSFLTLCEEFFAGLSIMHYTHPREVLCEISVWTLRFTVTDFKR